MSALDVNVFIGHCLATKVYIGKLPATRGVCVVIGWANGASGHGPTKNLQDLNWDAFDHAAHVPQLRSCNYVLHVHLHTYVMEYMSMDIYSLATCRLYSILNV